MQRCLLLALFACTASCTDGSPMLPIGYPYPVFSVIFQSQGAMNLEATLNGRTYRRSQAASFSTAIEVSLSPGTYTLSGTFIPGPEANDGFKVTFFSLPGAGGVLSGSLRDVSGPEPHVSDCNVTYLASGGAQNFSLRFDVSDTSNDALVCP